MFNLKDVLMDEIKTKRTRGFKVGRPTLWPSQAAVFCRDGKFIGKCLRASFYEKMGIKETNPVSDGVTLMGYMGTMIEDGLIEMLKNRGMWEANNVKWNNGIVSGEVDVIIKDLMSGKKWTVECKSCNGYHANKELFGFMSGREPNKKWTPGKPKDKHLLQSSIYADVGRETVEGVKLIYISRDEAKLQEFSITTDKDGNIYIDDKIEPRFNIADIYKCYDYLNKNLDEDTLPEPSYNTDYTDAEVTSMHKNGLISKTSYESHMSKEKAYMDKDCSYCQFRDLCLKDGFTRKNNYTKGNVASLANAPKDDLDFFDKIPTTRSESKPDFFANGSL